MQANGDAAELVLERLLERHGQPVSRELGIDLARNAPSPLFRWLCAALPMSAPIPHGAALSAARALSGAGWRTARTMADSAWRYRVDVLNRAGYGRLDESTARMLGHAARHLLDAHDGDLRRLREAAGRDPEAERAALKAFKGIGDVGADIFFRDLQSVWTEHFPFLDGKARAAARRLGLPEAPETLAGRVGAARFVGLATALMRAELDGVDRAQLLGAGAAPRAEPAASPGAGHTHNDRKEIP